MKTHRLGGGCRQCPADVSREWIGQCCTNHHQHQPTLPSKPPDSAPIRTQGSHPSKPTHTPPQGHQTQAPPVKSAQNAGHLTRHVAPARSAETTSTPLPCRTGHTSPSDRSSVVRRPQNNPASPHRHCGLATHSHCRLPKRSTSIVASNLPLLRTFPDERHATGARVLKRHAMKGKRSQEVVSRTRHFRTPAHPPPTTTTQGRPSQPGHTVPSSTPTHDTGNR